MRVDLSLSVCRKAVYRLMVELKKATKIPHIITVAKPVPNQTKKRGASADFGRLFKITR